MGKKQKKTQFEPTSPTSGGEASWAYNYAAGEGKLVKAKRWMGGSVWHVIDRFRFGDWYVEFHLSFDHQAGPSESAFEMVEINSGLADLIEGKETGEQPHAHWNPIFNNIWELANLNQWSWLQVVKALEEEGILQIALEDLAKWHEAQPPLSLEEELPNA